MQTKKWILVRHRFGSFLSVLSICSKFALGAVALTISWFAMASTSTKPKPPVIRLGARPEGLQEIFEWWGPLEGGPGNPGNNRIQGITLGKGNVRFFILKDVYDETTKKIRDVIWRVGETGELDDFSKDIPSPDEGQQSLGWRQLVYAPDDTLIAVGGAWEEQSRRFRNLDIWVRKNASLAKPSKWEKGPSLPIGVSAYRSVGRFEWAYPLDPNYLQISIVESIYLACVLENPRGKTGRPYPAMDKDCVPSFWKIGTKHGWEFHTEGWSGGCNVDYIFASPSGKGRAFAIDGNAIKTFDSNLMTWIPWPFHESNRDSSLKALQVLSDSDDVIVYNNYGPNKWISSNGGKSIEVKSFRNVLTPQGHLVGCIGDGIVDFDPATGSECRLDPFHSVIVKSLALSTNGKIVVEALNFVTHEQRKSGEKAASAYRFKERTSVQIAWLVFIGGMVLAIFICIRSKQGCLGTVVILVVAVVVFGVIAFSVWAAVQPNDRALG